MPLSLSPTNQNCHQSDGFADINQRNAMAPKEVPKQQEITEPNIDRDPWKLAANGILDRLETLVTDGLDVNEKDKQGVAPLVLYNFIFLETVCLQYNSSSIRC